MTSPLWKFPLSRHDYNFFYFPQGRFIFIHIRILAKHLSHILLKLPRYKNKYIYIHTRTLVGRYVYYTEKRIRR